MCNWVKKMKRSMNFLHILCQAQGDVDHCNYMRQTASIMSNANVSISKIAEIGSR